jgi:preprotein translocase subunit SecF
MIQLFHAVNIDWLGKRRIFIAISVSLMLAGMGSAVYRHTFHPAGTEAFNLGVDFKGGMLLTVRFKERPSTEATHAALERAGLREAIIQNTLEKPNEMLIKLPLSEAAESEGQGDLGRNRETIVRALATLGEGNAEIVGTDAVGAIAGKELRSRAIAVTFAALVGILLFIAFRFEWTYGAAAVIAVFHTVLIVLGLFSIFQWEVNMTVIAALLTLVGFSVNDSIVVFDRIRENLRLHRRMSLYDVTNLSINQTLSRTVITAGLVFLSVVALVLFGGPTLRPFSLALVFGIICGTYDSIAIASPIMVWWQQRIARSQQRILISSQRANLTSRSHTIKTPISKAG